MLLTRVVDTSTAVGATRSRKTKVDALATLLRECTPGEVPVVVCLLTGEPRQGRIGVGWATLSNARGPVRTAAGSSATVAELDATLDRIAATSGPGSGAARQTILGQLFERTTAAEADFVVRLLTGELRQGALAGLMADAIARAAGVTLDAVRRAAMLGGDLADTARRALTGGEPALADVRLQVLRPVQPMLAATAKSVTDALDATGAASVEWKLDGARIQVHRDGTDVRVFTRNLNDVTERLPEVVDVARSFPARRFVLDGEAIGMADDALPRRFQDTMSRFGRDGAATHDLALAPFFFDVLHLDDDDLLERPLAERSAILTTLAGPWRVPAVETDDTAVAAEFLADALGTRARGCHGQSSRLTLRSRTPGCVVAQGETGADARSRRARGRVGPRAATRLVVEPAPRGARSGFGRVRDGRQDVQRTHRRDAHVADREAPGNRGPAR